jgi:hypothetical protein
VGGSAKAFSRLCALDVRAKSDGELDWKGAGHDCHCL